MRSSMNDPKKFIERKEIQLFLKSIGGEYAPILAANMIEPISDEDLAAKCNIRAADVRMILNKMHYMGVIDYNRSKDKESGWYYYGWFVRLDKLIDAYLQQKEEDLKNIEQRLNDSDAFTLYICRKCEQTYDFDRATSLLYHCPLCETILDRDITDEDLKKMARMAEQIRKETSEIRRQFGHLHAKKYKTMKVI